MNLSSAVVYANHIPRNSYWIWKLQFVLCCSTASTNSAFSSLLFFSFISSRPNIVRENGLDGTKFCLYSIKIILSPLPQETLLAFQWQSFNKRGTEWRFNSFRMQSEALFLKITIIKTFMNVFNFIKCVFILNRP